MFNLITAIILIVISTICLTLIAIGCIRNSIKECFTYTAPKLLLSVAIVFIIIAINLFIIGIGKIQSNAIDHYIVGDVEKVEILSDGEVIDWYYKIINVDYD